MYKLILDADTKQPQGIWKIADNVQIPFDPANTDYQAYLRWCEEGNTPEPADQGEQQ